MKKATKRFVVFCSTTCMLLSQVPMYVFAQDVSVGTQVITNTKTPPKLIEGNVWELIDSDTCLLIEHEHTNDCYYKTCDHKNGHLPDCYSTATAYTLCEHTDESLHTGSVTLADVVKIDGTNVTWKKDHPAYSVVYEVYKKAYDETYASTKLSFMKETAAKAAGVAALVGKKFCYVTATSDEPDQCTHTCSHVGGDCYTKICLLPEHKHADDCFQYTWELKADVNKNGVADDSDSYHLIKYMIDDEVFYEESVLIGMPTPIVSNPVKEADAQYTYSFIGWDKTISDTVTEDAIYTALFNKTLNTYEVKWLDEDGTELEVDENVEYGVLPTYDGELPSKSGNNTISYTFAGWSPSVSAVNGDATYTATYSTKNVYPVNYYINNELVKTEYVVDGEQAIAYNPTKEHYKLSNWNTSNGEYNFTNQVSNQLDLYASWELIESTVKFEGVNATCNLENNGIYSVNQLINLEIIPDNQYVIEKVFANDEELEITYSEGKAQVQLYISDKTPEYTLRIETSKAKLMLKDVNMNIFGDISAEHIWDVMYDEKNSNPSDLTFEDIDVKYLAFEIELLGKKYEWWAEPGTDVSLESFLGQYGLSPLASYIPAEKLPHKFASQNVEKVQVVFAGNDKFPSLTQTGTVTFVDERIETQVILNKDVEVVYGATEEEILNLVFDKVVAENVLVSKDINDVTIKMDNLNAGTRKAVVSFSGNDTYKASSCEVDVKINKATSTTKINSTVVKYGTELNVSDLIDTNASRIEILLGVSAGDNISADVSSIAYVKLPSLLNTDNIENETVKALVEKVVNKIENNLNRTVTIEELSKILNDIVPYLENLKEQGYDINLDTNSIQSTIAALQKLSEQNGIKDLKVKLVIGDDLVVSDSGIYLAAAVVSDGNYKTSFDMGYMVVYPDGYKADLDWKIHDKNGIITIHALRNGYDLSAYVPNIYEGTIEDATAHLKTLFVGLDSNGNFVLTQNQEELGFGAYTQIAFLADFGNTMYYAEPIIRSFVVTADLVDVKFIDEFGNINHDRIFAYGKDATMTAKAYNRNGEEILDGTMTYYYSGIQTNGKLYTSATAPTYPGVYNVVALFNGVDSEMVGATTATLVVEQKESDFELISKTVEYDGKSHFVDVIDTAELKHIYIIVDENDNVNIILPDSMNDLNESLKEKLNEYLTSPEVMVLSDGNDYWNNVLEKLNVNSIELNGELPTEVGAYNILGIAFGKADYKLAADTASLTIEKVKEDDKSDEKPKDEVNPDDDEEIKPDKPSDEKEPIDKPDDDINKPSDNPENNPDDEIDEPGETPKDNPEDKPIKEENKKPNPEKPSIEKGPGTGDGTDITLWYASLIASLAGLIGLITLKRKFK